MVRRAIALLAYYLLVDVMRKQGERNDVYDYTGLVVP